MHTDTHAKTHTRVDKGPTCCEWLLCRDGSPGTLSDLRSASVNNTRLASVAVLHQIHTFIRHCSTPLFHDISLFVEQLQQAVSDQEKKIIEQQVALRQQQRQAQLAAALAAGEEPGDVSMTDGEVGKKHVAGEEDLNHTPAKRQRSNSLERIQSSDPLSKSAELLPGAENAPAVDAQLTAQLDPSAELNQTIQKVSPFQDEFADLDDSIQVTLASMTDETDNPEAAAATDSAKQPTDAEMETQAQLKPAGSDLASVPADCTPAGSTALPDSAIAAAIAATDQEPTNAANGIKDFGNGIEHPLGGPKVDKPKRRKKYVRDSVKVQAVPIQTLWTYLRCPVHVYVCKCTSTHASSPTNGHSLLYCVVRLLLPHSWHLAV